MFHQLLLPITLSCEKLTENFVVGDSNWEAFTWIQRWPHWPSRHLIIHGDSCSGKSHLAHLFHLKSNAYLIKEEDLSQSPDICLKKASAFIVDDYDLIQDENWLFHFYNLTREHNFDVLFCGRQSPRQFLFTLPDLQSRMRSVLSIIIPSPDELLLKKIFKQRLSNLGISLPHDFDDICYYVLNRIERSYLSLNSLILKINDTLLRDQKALSFSLIREILTRPFLSV